MEKFIVPQYPLRRVAEVIGLPPRTIGPWISKHGPALELDADAGREEGRYRLYSPRDVFRLQVVAALLWQRIDLQIGTAAAAALARRVAPEDAAEWSLPENRDRTLFVDIAGDRPTFVREDRTGACAIALWPGRLLARLFEAL